MNICLVSLDYPSSFGGGGVGTQMRDIARALVTAGHQVSVIDLARPGLPEFENDHEIKVYRIHGGNLHWYIKKIPWIGTSLSTPLRELEYGQAVYRKVKQLHNQTPFDLIEGTETGSLGVALKFKDAPVALRLHGEVYTFTRMTPGMKLGIEHKMTRYLQRIALRKARMLIAVSYAHAQEISHELKGIHPPIEVVYNFIDLKRNMPPARERDKATILYVGRIEPRKGPEVLLKAAAQVVREFPEAKIVFAGAPHSLLRQEKIDSLIQKHHLKDHVSFPGHIPLEQLAEWYGRATFCVLPSYYETFGISALESIAYGVPIVTTRIGGLPEVVEDGVTGILIPVGDFDALAQAMIRLLRDPELRKKMGEAGRIYAREKFNPEALAAQNIEIYKRLVHTSVKVFGERRHIFFSPHFDDGVFSCGGLMDSLIADGKEVKVVTVFSGKMANGVCSAFGRHLLAKWGLGKDFQNERLAEDNAALSALHIQDSDHWGLTEAPYRQHSHGPVLYASFDELRGSLHAEDNALVKKLSSKIKELNEQESPETVFYFPLSFGAHVDHQILFSMGVQLAALGRKVRFYEDWPYAEEHDFFNHPEGWFSQNIDIRLENKIKAILEYKSQIKGLADSPEKVSRRAKLFLSATGHKRPQERYWELMPEAAHKMLEKTATPHFSFSKKQPRYSLRDFVRFLAIFRWHDLTEILPNGQGICLDIGCGNGRHRQTIEKKGYRWKGLDRKAPVGNTQDIQGDIQSLPIQSGSLTAATAWQVMEYVEELESVLSEAARVLEIGGVFCGSVSFLEPLHGKSYYGMSPAILEKLLKKYGFVDVQLKPGLCGFSLMLWTWFRRLGGDGFARLALPLSAIGLIPLAAARFLISWIGWRLGLGTAHGMDWIVNKAPLEFAGHIMFLARKPAGNRKCTSAS